MPEAEIGAQRRTLRRLEIPYLERHGNLSLALGARDAECSVVGARRRVARHEDVHPDRLTFPGSKRERYGVEARILEIPAVAQVAKRDQGLA